MVQAKSDTYSYGLACLSGNEYYCDLYGQALLTISSIKSGLEDLYTSEVIWDDGNQQLITYYLPFY